MKTLKGAILKGFNKVKKFTKKMEVVFGYQAILTPSKSKSNASKGAIRSEVMVVASQESMLLRAAKRGLFKFADSNFANVKLGCHEILTLKISKSIIGHDYRDIMLDKIFARIVGFGLGANEGIYLIINKNGTARLSWYPPTKNDMAVGRKAYQYKFLNISASGLRSGSLTMAAVKEYHYNKGSVAFTNCDRREHLLNAATNDAYSLNFKEVDLYKKLKKSDAFKALNRIANGNAPSKETYAIQNSIVFNNISQYACYNKNNPLVSCHTPEVLDAIKADNKEKLEEMGIVRVQDTTDGLVFLSSEPYHAHLAANNVPVKMNDINGTVDQIRNSTLKVAGLFSTRRENQIICNHLVEIGTDIDYIIKDGKQVFNFTEQDVKDVIMKLDMIADRNGIKLRMHNDALKVNVLKMAYESDTNLSQILVLSMCLVDLAGTKALLNDKITEMLSEAFTKVGVKFNMVDGEIVSSAMAPLSVKAMNNSTQAMEYLFKSEPEKVLACFPYAVRHIIANDIESICNRITDLSFTTDAKYTVIQSDKSVLFGCRLLADNECFIPSLGKSKLVAAMRQPQSGPNAVSVFINQTVEMMNEKVKATDLSDDAKWVLNRLHKNMKGFNLIPASHYLMEKHDGMDFDIDAMMFYFEDRVVAILKKIKEQGVKISRNSDDHIETADDKAVSAWLNGETTFPVRPGTLSTITEDVVNAEVAVTADQARRVTNVRNKFAAISKSQSETEAINSLVEMVPDSLALIVRDFFKNPIADVGTITTGLYNNIAMLICLIDIKTNEDIERANQIVAALVNHYGCNDNFTRKEYVSPIDRSVDRELGVSKEIVCEMIYRFSESNGTLAEVITFVEDCCLANRYPAESSIDTVKNGYYIQDYVNHRSILACLGIDKHMKFISIPFKNDMKVNELKDVTKKSSLGEVEELCSERAEAIYKHTLSNVLGKDLRKPFLNLPMVDKLIKKRDAAMEIIDPIADLKMELVEQVNGFICLAEGEIANFVTSDEAKTIRAQVRELIAGNNIDGANINMKSIIASISNAYRSLTLNVDNEDMDMTEDDKFKAMVSKEYINTAGIASIRNFAKVSFNKLGSAEIGMLVVNHYIDLLEVELASPEKRVNPINPGVIKVLENEFFEGLMSIGFENIGYISEKIDSVVTDRYVAATLVEGEEIEVVGGVGTVTVDGVEYMVNTNAKKATITGEIVEVAPKKFEIISERPSSIDETEMGMLCTVNQYNLDLDIQSCIDRAVSYEFVAGMTLDKTTIKNCLVAKFEDGTSEVLCTLYMNENSKKFMVAASKLDLLTSENVLLFSKALKDADGNALSEESFDVASGTGCVMFNNLYAHAEEIKDSYKDKKAVISTAKLPTNMGNTSAAPKANSITAQTQTNQSAPTTATGRVRASFNKLA